MDFPRVPSVEPVALPRFPTFFELLEQPEESVKVPTGLFQLLLGGRIDILQEDATQNPDKYDETTRALLDQAVHRKGSFTLSELDTLNQATVLFASASTKLPLQKQRPTPRRAPLASKEELPPNAEVQPFWWL